jgi:pimeloyl-ACP methyl ester carboxylesterase
MIGSPEVIDRHVKLPLPLGRVRIATTEYPPAPTAEARSAQVIVVAVPGGGIRRGYFELGGLAAALVSRGHRVVALDPLGTGDSDQVTGDDAIGTAEVAAAMAGVVDQLRAEAARSPLVVGVGHSLGAYLLLHQQADHASYDALICLGYSHAHNPIALAPEPGPPESYINPDERYRRAARVLADSDPALWRDPYVDFHRPPPPAGPRADEREAAGKPDVTVETSVADSLPACLRTVVPRRVAIEFVLAERMPAVAAAVAVPVLVVFGQHDLVGHVSREPHTYTASPRVDTFELAGAGHLHQLALTAPVLNDRIADWLEQLVRRAPGATPIERNYPWS